MAAVPFLRDNNMTAVVSHENTPTLLDYFGTLLHCMSCSFVYFVSFFPSRGAWCLPPPFEGSGVLTEPPGGDARRILNY